MTEAEIPVRLQPRASTGELLDVRAGVLRARLRGVEQAALEVALMER